MSARETTEALCRRVAREALEASPRLRGLPAGERTGVLREMARGIRASRGTILEANAADLREAGGLSEAMRDRLRLDDARVEAMASAVEAIAVQADPIGEVIESRRLESGVFLEKRRVPIGVVLMIYESRPNVTSDAAGLCVRSGNAVILRGGKESARSNGAVASAIRGPMERLGLGGAIGFIDTADRSAIEHLVRMEGVIDVVIPRGGPGLIAAVTGSSRIPVIKHDAGNCHVYVDRSLAGLEESAERIVVNAKAQRPGVCNAAETLLIHREAAERMTARLCGALARAGVEVRGDERVCGLFPGARRATEEDWATEYLALIIAVRIVDSLEEAAAHVRRWGSRHTEAIITSDAAAAERFIGLVDSASVMVNCSTRLADGGEFGLGAEIGISTTKLHARGPMGAADLTTFQWVALGSGQIRM